MAPMLFARAILAGEPIKVFNHGKMQRDFTYIDDIVEGVLRCCDKPATANAALDPLQPDPATAAAPHRVFNIGNSQPTELLRFIAVMEEAPDREAIKDFQPMQHGDVVATAADAQALRDWVGFKPSTSIDYGVKNFIEWYIDFVADRKSHQGSYLRAFVAWIVGQLNGTYQRIFNTICGISLQVVFSSQLIKLASYIS